MSPDGTGRRVAWRRWAPLVFIPVAVLYLWPLALHPNWVAFPPGSSFTDLLLSHLPNAIYWRDALTRYGQWPLWNGQIYAGLPFAADPLAGLWYPPDLALLVLPLPFGFNLLLALHLAWAGFGLFRFLRSEGLGGAASGLGAVAFAGTPKLVAHLGAGHVSLVYAVAWTPWLLLAVRQATRATARHTLRAGAVAGAVLAILFLADVRWAFYAGLLALAYGMAISLRPGAKVYLNAVLAFGVFFALLSAVLALPLAEFVPLASRSGLTLADGGTYSLPPRYLLGLLIPDLHGFHEWMTYLGAVPLLLALAGIGRRTLFWAAVAVTAVAYSLGTNFVLFPAVFRALPLAGLLRVPPRAWFLVALSAAVLASRGLQRLLDDWLPFLMRRYIALNIWLPSASATVAVLLVLTVLDLVRVDGTLLDVRPAPRLPAASAWLQQQTGLFRVYSPSFSLPYGDGLQHVDGVDPLQVSRALGLIGAATGVSTTSYSVTVPPFGSDDLANANAGARLSPTDLARLDVKFVAAEFDVQQPGFGLVQTFGRTRVYQNEAWAGRAWVEGASTSGATVTFWSPNQVRVQAHGPGMLVVSEVDYPGWVAQVDGQPASLETADSALRAVRLGPGAHVVSFEFRPFSVYLGAALGALGLVGLAVLLWPQRAA